MSQNPQPRFLHLVRHGEVENPDHVVYADLDGFGLSTRGITQAEAAASYLASAPVALVVASPLERARETAGVIIAAHPNARFEVDEGLTEWRLGSRWAGTVWEELDERFPGELEAYLTHPDNLPFSPEPLGTAGRRFAKAAEAAFDSIPDGDVVVVSHQDPVQAGRLTLTGRSFDNFHQRKPGHAAVITLTPPAGPESDWRRTHWWEPDQGPAFPPLADSSDT
jgi:broad specificity phosphatase PhoE